MIVHYILVITFTSAKIFILFLIYTLGHPYMAEFMITPEPFMDLVNHVEMVIKAGKIY